MWTEWDSLGQKFHMNHSAKLSTHTYFLIPFWAWIVFDGTLWTGIFEYNKHSGPLITQSSWFKYCLERQMCVNPQLKIVPEQINYLFLFE